MPYPPQNIPTKTVIQRIIEAWTTRLTAMVDEDGKPLWNNVVQNAIGGISALAMPVVTLQQGDEETVHLLYPHIEKVCTVYIEFRFNPLGGVDSAAIFRYYLGKLQARLYGTTDHLTIGGLATNVLEIGNQPEIESQSDPAPGGTLTSQIYYRHWQADPYHLPEETPIYAYGNN